METAIIAPGMMQLLPENRPLFTPSSQHILPMARALPIDPVNKAGTLHLWSAEKKLSMHADHGCTRAVHLTLAVHPCCSVVTLKGDYPQ